MLSRFFHNTKNVLLYPAREMQQAKEFFVVAKDTFLHNPAETIISVATGLAQSITAVTAPLLLKTVLDGFFQHEEAAKPELATPDKDEATTQYLMLISLGYALLWSMSKISRTLHKRSRTKLVSTINSEYIPLVINHINHLPMEFHQNTKPGDLINIITSIPMASMEVMGNIYESARNAFELLAITGLIYNSLDYYKTSALGFILVSNILINYYRTTLQKAPKESWVQNDKALFNYMVDSIRNHEAISAYSNEDHEHQVGLTVQQRVIESFLKMDALETEALISKDIINGLCIALLNSVIAYDILYSHPNSQYTAADLALINLSYINFIVTLSAMDEQLHKILRYTGDLKRSAELLRIKPVINASGLKPKLKISDGLIEFKNVVFSPQQKPVLKDVSLQIDRHKITTIIGHTGAGKSTIGKLLMRFYDTTSGKILIDGQDISLLDVKSLRQHITYMSQEAFIFNRSLYNNLVYAKPQQAIAADVLQRALDFSLLNDYSAQDMAFLQTNHDVATLSGGEKQRLAMARAYIKNSAIWVLDEFSSALDNATTKGILDQIKSNFQQKTVVIITHDLNIAKDYADNIIVMRDGQVAEVGTHVELMQKKGLYFQNWQQDKATSFASHSNTIFNSAAIKQVTPEPAAATPTIKHRAKG